MMEWGNQKEYSHIYKNNPHFLFVLTVRIYHLSHWDDKISGFYLTMHNMKNFQNLLTMLSYHYNWDLNRFHHQMSSDLFRKNHIVHYEVYTQQDKLKYTF